MAGIVTGSPGASLPGYVKVNPVTFGGDPPAEGGSATVTAATREIYVAVLGPKVPSVGDKLVCKAVGGRWVAETCCSGTSCGKICVTVVDYCGTGPDNSIYCPACDEYIAYDYMVTDALGAYPWSSSWALGWQPGPFLGTSIHAFASTNLWNPDRLCEGTVSGSGQYGYYWKFNPDTVSLVMRVYADICPGGQYGPAPFLFSAPDPPVGNTDNDSGDFGITPNDPYSGTITVSVVGAGISTSFVGTWNGTNETQTFKIHPTGSGIVTLTATNNGGLANPPPQFYTVRVPGVAGAYAVNPPSPNWGSPNVESGDFVVTPDGVYTGTVTISGSIVLTWNNSSDPQTFTITPDSPGNITLFFANSGGLIDPKPLLLAYQTFSSFADAAFGSGTGIFVEYESAVKPACTPFTNTFSFSEPTRYGDSSGRTFPGSPPIGTVTRPVGLATLTASVVANPYVKGAVVTMVDRNNKVVGSCTIPSTGTCCMDMPSPDQYWIYATAPGCQQVSCADPPPRQEINVTCGATCIETVPCTACDADIDVIGGTARDSHGSFPLTYDYSRSFFLTSRQQFLSQTAYGDDSFSNECIPGPASVIYYYVVFCDGDNLTLQVWTYPISVCPYDDSVCGYFTGNVESSVTLALVNTWTQSVAPTCDGSAVTATFTLNPDTSVCGTATPIPPPSTTVTVSIPISAQNRVACCASSFPCPIPRRDINLSWDGPTAGSTTLAYSLSGTIPSWTAPGYTLTCLGLGITGVAILTNPIYYVCKPLFVQYLNAGITYTIEG
jgi:hypothetical protein